MAHQENSDIPAGMRKVHGRLERWRKARRGRAPIPKGLWEAAGRVAREHGVNPTSKALGLEFNKLRTFAESGRVARAKVTAPPQFLELVSAAAANGAECVIEMEGPRGKMRIEWRGAVAPDLASLGRMLWEHE